MMHRVATEREQKLTWKEVAISHAELDFDVDPIGVVPFDERRPQPVVDVVVCDIAHHV